MEQPSPAEDLNTSPISLEAEQTVRKLPPRGFCRGKVFNRSIITQVLVDSGNLYGDLISEELASKLKMKIYGPKKKVGVAKGSVHLEILGRVRPFSMYLEGLKHPVKICPEVARGLTHPVNIGQAMLRSHEADLQFRLKDIQLKVKGQCVPLHPPNLSLTRASMDVRFVRVLDQWSKMGGNPPEDSEVLDARVHSAQGQDDEGVDLPGLYKECYKRKIYLKNTKQSVLTRAETRIPSKTSKKIELKFNKHNCPPEGNNWVYFDPCDLKMNYKGSDILIHPGIYPRKGEIISVTVSNLGEDESILPANLKVGIIFESDGMGEDPAINTLNHKPVDQLTAEELEERRQFIKESLKLDENVSSADRAKLEAIFFEHFDALSVGEHDFGKTDLLKFHIQVPKDVVPIRAKCRPLNPSQEENLKKQLDEWIAHGLVEPSISPWASALVPVAKKDGGLRWCCDFRSLNRYTVTDSYPLPNIDANLHKLGKAKFFTALDSRGAFHNMEIEPGSRDYTTFTSPFGSYRWLRLPFGVKNGPAAFSRLIMMALQHLPPGFALAYIDDLIVYSSTMEEHFEHLRAVLAMHLKFGMKLNLKKCHVAKQSVEYLGHLVSAKGIQMIPSYVERVLEWPLPRNAQDLRSFLGFTGYYRNFIKKYGELTVRLNNHRNDKQAIEWTEQEMQDFENLKLAFRDQPVRGFPDYDSKEPFILDTDWSSLNMAAVLSQKQNNQERFLGCVAKKCSASERNYPSHKGELASCILGLKKFEHILRAKPFIIRTDSKCLEFLQSLKDARGMFARWITFLSSFDYTIVHRKGAQQKNADALSRMPGLDPTVETDGLNLDIYEDIADVHSVIINKPELSTFNLREVARFTREDHILNKIFSWIERDYTPTKEDRKVLTKIGLNYANCLSLLSIHQGVLYYHQNDDQQLRLVLPEKLWSTAFEICHAHALCGHVGINTTLTKIKERFYFPGLRSYVIQKVQTCLMCLKKNKTVPKLLHQQHHEFSSYFGQRICIDTVGPLNKTEFNRRTVVHIFTMQDSFTRYLTAVPIPDLEAETLAQELVENWIFKFGIPEQIHSDRGTSFTSALFKEVMTTLGIKKTVTPPYCPRGDRVERAHKVLGEILRSDSNSPDKDWAIKLPAAVLAYNVASNRITGISPFEAVFGQRAVLPVDFLFPCTKQKPVKMAEFIDIKREQIKEITQRMIQKEYHSIQLDPKYRPREIENPLSEGDTVYLFTTRLKPNIAAKLQSPWTGPWLIQRVITQSLVEIRPRGQWCKRPHDVVTTIDRIKKIDEDSLTRNDMFPAEQLDLTADELLNNDEDEDDIVIPAPGIYFPVGVADNLDIAESMPRYDPIPDIKLEIQDEIYDDYDRGNIPEVVHPDTGQTIPPDGLDDELISPPQDDEEHVQVENETSQGPAVSPGSTLLGPSGEGQTVRSRKLHPERALATRKRFSPYEGRPTLDTSSEDEPPVPPSQPQPVGLPRRESRVERTAVTRRTKSTGPIPPSRVSKQLQERTVKKS